MTSKNNPGIEHLASAKMKDVGISTKHSVEISNYLRYKSTAFAKQFLADVIALKKPVPFKKFNKDMGHKKGMSAGRFPQNAAREFLRLVNSVEANAQSKGLNTSSLKIIKILANKASIPFTGGRQRHGTKRSHLEIEVKEMGKKEKKESKKGEKKEKVMKEKKASEKKEESKVEKKEEKPTKTAPQPTTLEQEEHKGVIEDQKESIKEEKDQPETIKEKTEELITEPENKKSETTKEDSKDKSTEEKQ